MYEGGMWAVVAVRVELELLETVGDVLVVDRVVVDLFGDYSVI